MSIAAKQHTTAKQLKNDTDDFLTKPFELSELKARVRAGLRLYQANQDLQAQKHLLKMAFGEAYVRSAIAVNRWGEFLSA